MKKSLLLLCCALALPVIAQANVSVDLNVPGVSLHLGDQDQRGYYWDGYDWRPPQWWHDHKGHHYGERNEHGMYWHGNRWDAKPPQRGHDKPGHNQPGPQPHNQGRPNGHDNNGHQGNGQPIPPNGYQGH
ncbi:DUF2502 domain-containing protein [Rahnella aquatilis]|uniref:DUF2502 domain-containing protein n=1 Tax=Rahnella aquatilis (strain ATCC 33071 / DSM 4594 / JCM 1683 / NBRC 105701 / NCIMB 13365 / CIP 78.65) TaxID=745277 RepID=H2ITA4_RAHAC|nr:DUF2502 domain-containing protein [Rahnella aquatilis]AEX52688.1 Protein of unknown function (DUF2502) [Rahnella aquatilis CIP 78.65 = ATCC 33071]KFD05620.1 putative exported protein [Rahnella aquatilis CIP 78.65 = ATCC 33071]